ncbi:MAG: hypothetical protein Hals2KO_05640 [Halioglobus sp.]
MSAIKTRCTTLLLACLVALGGCGSGSDEVIGGPVAMRKISAEQYRNIIADTFGSRIEVSGRFEPANRRDGLNAIGTSHVAVTPSGFEQYEALARSIAAQVVASEHREALMPCRPVAQVAGDDACTQTFITHYGQRLLRRPLTDSEVQLRVANAQQAAADSGDFYTGIELALSSLLVAPDFLFRIEEAVPAPTPEQPDRQRVADYTLASRLSFFLWNRGPDEQLLAAAARGELATDEGVQREVDRMLASEHLAGGARAFFYDLFMFDQFDDVSKDAARYPLFTRRLADDAMEQTLRFTVDHLIAGNGDYRQLFTSRELPMTRSLGPLYGIPVRSADGWETSRFPDNQPRAGLLSHGSFAMLHAHPGRSSPTLRGVFMREALLCQTIPEAPADVDFTLFSEDGHAQYKTARERLQVHSNEPSCNKCHVLTDPIGLGLEVFDGIGSFRTAENGAAIDSSGDFDGKRFSDPVELGRAFAENELVAACLVENLYRYAVGRPELNRERRLLRQLEKQFAAANFTLPALMRDIALSSGFRTASPARESSHNEQTASSNAVTSPDPFAAAKETI